MSDPVPHSEVRAADADRAAVAEVLGEAMRAGRLTVEEYDERLAAAYAARTHGELAVLTTDLPAPQPTPRPVSVPTASDSCEQNLRNAWRGWLTVTLIVWTIYLASSLSSGWQYPWPIWVMGPWGAVLLARTLTSRGNRT